MSGELTAEQKAFLEECESEFCNRFTDADKEYKLVKEAGIPPVPIVHPWNPKLTPRYRGAGGNRFWNNRQNDRHRNREQHSNDRHRNRGQQSRSRSRSNERNRYNYRPEDRRYRD